MITPPDSPNELVSLIHHLISLAIGCPFYVAWIAVRGYLKKQGIYESLCNQLISEDGDCSPRVNHINISLHNELKDSQH